jgi:hypothetical protein
MPKELNNTNSNETQDKRFSSALSDMLDLRKILLEINRKAMDSFSLSNDNIENLNYKDQSFLYINQKIVNALRIIDNLK